ncbi:MAG: hypothetical protein ACP5LB_05350 [Candidatus Bathyarchaeia archaeon]
MKLGPQTFEQLNGRRQFKLFLNPAVYKAFMLRCKIEKRKPNIIVESFMIVCLENPMVINLIERLSKPKM